MSIRDLVPPNLTAGRRGRYAPSPTGPLHPGNVRTALIAWLQCRLVGGTFVLRMEDLDRPRTVEGSAEQILDDLRWLGLDWDEGPDVGGPCGPYTQSGRDDIYEHALQELVERNLVFECFCSRRDIAEASSAPHGTTPVYPGTCRTLNPAEIREVRLAKSDRTAAWRFRVGDRTVDMSDEILGAYTQSLCTDVGDFVLRRADELFAYQLAVVVDDILMGITDVVRGSDLLESTPRQIALFDAFGFEPPQFWHAPLMLDETGRRMSKRGGAESLHTAREGGKRPGQLVGALAASLGLVEAETEISPRELLKHLDLPTLRARLRGSKHKTQPGV